LRGNVLAASVTGAIGLAVLLFVLWRVDVLFELAALGRRGPAWGRDTRPGVTIGALARLGGLVVPLGTIVWAAASQAPGLGTTGGVRWLSAAAWIVLAAVGLLFLQGLAIAWLRPVSDAYVVERAAEAAAHEFDRGPPVYPDRSPRGPGPGQLVRSV